MQEFFVKFDDKSWKGRDVKLGFVIMKFFGEKLIDFVSYVVYLK